ncbi:hypothetical protein HOY80DRAFT_1006037 [Tuber brumale]|nr:hypothetical protein HOY80DRAFT_1006037 [Tuber brumale]
MPPRKKGGRKPRTPLAGSGGQERSGRGRTLEPFSTSGGDAHPSRLARGDAHSSIDWDQGTDSTHRTPGISGSAGDSELPSLFDSRGFGSDLSAVHGLRAEVPVLSSDPMLSGSAGDSEPPSLFDSRGFGSDLPAVYGLGVEVPVLSLGPTLSGSTGDSELPSLFDSRGFGSDIPAVHSLRVEVPVFSLGPTLRTEVAGERPQATFWTENGIAAPTGLHESEGTSFFHERMIDESGPIGGQDPFDESAIHPAFRQRPLQAEWDIEPKFDIPSHYSGPSYRGPDREHSPLRRDPFNTQKYNWDSDDDDDYSLSGSHHGRHLGHESLSHTSTHTSSFFTGGDNTTRGTPDYPFSHPPRLYSPGDPSDSFRLTSHNSGDFRGSDAVAPRTCRRPFTSRHPFPPGGGHHGTIADNYRSHHAPPWGLSRRSRSANNLGNPVNRRTHDREPHTREPPGGGPMIRGSGLGGSVDSAVALRFQDMSFSHQSPLWSPGDDWETPKGTGQDGTEPRPQ